jgi:UMF1 family MFS transporter
MPLFTTKQQFGWSMYDWANSAFATTVMAAFFPAFFKEYWAKDLSATESTAILGAANSIAGLMVAFMAPVLGAIADCCSGRKRFLIFFAYLGVLSTAALFAIQQGHWLLAAGIYVFGSVGFSGANAFYDSLLPLVAPADRVDFVSGIGYAMGYLGGGLLLALNVWMTLSPTTFGLADAGQAVRASFVTVAVWWGLFSLPIIFLVKEPEDRRSGTGSAVPAGIKQLRETFRKIKHLKTILLFLVGYWFYIDGVDTIVRMAVDYGLSIGFQRNDLILALLITQFVGFPSAIFFGRVGEKIGPKRAIFIAIGVYLVVVVWAMFIQTKYEFFGIAFTVGLVQGGIQAMSRSFYARIIPHDKAGEFYGFYNFLGKFAVILGPILIGVTGLISNSPRVGIGSIAVLFLIGGILLSLVDEKKGAEEVKYLVRENAPKT